MPQDPVEASMDQAVVTAVPIVPVAIPVETPVGFVAKMQALPPPTKFKFGIGLAALLATVVAMVLWSRQGDWRVLYSNLPDKDAGAVVAQLGQMNVPYRYSEGGTAILVPADKIYDLKMKLAAAGLP